MNLIKNEPKIIKELREDERLGLLKSSAKIYHKESVFEEKSDYTVLNDKFFSNEKNLDLIIFSDKSVNNIITSLL